MREEGANKAGERGGTINTKTWHAWDTNLNGTLFKYVKQCDV